MIIKVLNESERYWGEETSVLSKTGSIDHEDEGVRFGRLFSDELPACPR